MVFQSLFEMTTDCAYQSEENGVKFEGMMLGGLATKLGNHHSVSTAADNSYCVGSSDVDKFQVSLQFLV